MTKLGTPVQGRRATFWRGALAVFMRTRLDLRAPRVLPLPVTAWLQPPRGSEAVATWVDVQGHWHECLACQLTYCHRLPQVSAWDGDNGVPQATLRAGLVRWHDDVEAWQHVDGRVEAWQAR